MKKLLLMAFALIIPSVAFAGGSGVSVTGTGTGGGNVTPSISSIPNLLPSLNALDISSSLVANATYSSGNATTNAAAINAAIISANAGTAGTVNTVSINVPGTYYSNQIIMYSNTILELGAGVILKKPPSTVASMIINHGALQTPNVVDTNIAIIGLGTIDGNAANQSQMTRAFSGVTSGTYQYGIQGEVVAAGVNNFTLQGVTLYDTNGFGLQWIGNTAVIQGVRCNTSIDCLHVNGPSQHLYVNNLTGFAQDVFIGLNAWDWHVSGPTVGTIQDVHIWNSAYYGSNDPSGGTGRTGDFITLLPGTRSTQYGQGTGNVTNVSIDGFVCDMSQGTVTPGSACFQLSMSSDLLQAGEYSGAGTISGVNISNGYIAMPNSNCPAIYFDATGITASGQASVTIKDFHTHNVFFDSSVGTGNNSPILAPVPYDTWLVDDMTFEDSQWTPSSVSSQNQEFINWGNKTAADSIAVKGLVINSNTATGFTSAFLSNVYSAGNPSVVNNLTLDFIRTAPGYQLTTPWLFMTGGVIKQLNARGEYLIGSGGGSDLQGIYFASSTSQIIQGVISDSYFSGVKEMVTLSAAIPSGSGVGATLVFQNDQIVNSTHPFFATGASKLDLTFLGGSINSGNHLGQVSGSAVTASYSDVIETGAGLGQIGVASGTLEIRKSDRIPIATAATVLTPANGDIVSFAGTPAYTGAVVVSGSGAGIYTYQSAPIAGWVKNSPGLTCANFAAPTVASGFGSTPGTVTTGTNACSFQVTVGTGGGASGVLTLPAAPHGWKCGGVDQTTQSSTNAWITQTANSTTSSTLSSFAASGSAGAWTGGDALPLGCDPN